jgi:hypothetical protein
MLANKLIKDMYSCLNQIANEFNAIGLTMVPDANVVRKIILLQPHDNYASSITILCNLENLTTMTPVLFIGKIVTFEMSHKMGQEASSSSKQCIALSCDEHKKMKKGE